MPHAEVTTIFVQGEEDVNVVRGVGGASVEFLQQPGTNLRGIKFAQIFRLHKLLGSRQFDVVIAHRYKAIYLAGILSYFRNFSILLGVAHEHKVFQRITRKLFVTFWRRKFLVAGVSESVVNDIANRCPSLLTENRLFRLPNVLREGFTNTLKSREGARAELELGRDDYVIGFVGRLVKKKSLPVLLQGFAHHLEKYSEAKLVLLGEGPERETLESLIVELNIQQRVKLMGHVPDAGTLVRVFDVFVLPSGEAEAFGLVLLEAMAAGVPVISSTAPGPAQVHGDPDWQFAVGQPTGLAEKLQRWRELDAATQSQLVERNLKRVTSEFSPASFRQKLDLVLDKEF